MSDGKGGTFRRQKVVGIGSGSYTPPRPKEEEEVASAGERKKLEGPEPKSLTSSQGGE